MSIITPEEARRLVARAIAAGAITLPIPEPPKRGGRQNLGLTKSGHEYNDIYRRTGKLLGICYRHVTRQIPVKPGRQLCAECADIQERYRRKNYAIAAEAGICNNHITRPVPVAPGKTKCEPCLELLRRRNGGGKRGPYRPRKLTQPATHP